MNTRSLGAGGPRVSVLGLGCMGVSDFHGPADQAESIVRTLADACPLVGAQTRRRLAEALGALELELSGDDLAAIERAVPVGAAAAERYDKQARAENGARRFGRGEQAFWVRAPGLNGALYSPRWQPDPRLRPIPR